MAEQRKISELTEVTTINDDDELVFVKYEDGNPGPEPTPIDVTSDESFYLKYPDLYDGRYHGLYANEGEFIPEGQRTLGTSKYQWWKGPIPPVIPNYAPYQFIVRMHTNQVQWEFCYLHIPGNGITGGMNQYAYSGNAAAPFKWPWEVEWFESSTGNALGNFISDEPWPITFDSLINTYANLSGHAKVDVTSGTDYIIGTIVYVDLEGGFYGIELPSIDGGAKYLPINIQSELVGNEGKEIKITVAWSKLNDDGLVGIWQWGKLIFVDAYEIIELRPTLETLTITGHKKSDGTLSEMNGNYVLRTPEYVDHHLGWTPHPNKILNADDGYEPGYWYQHEGNDARFIGFSGTRWQLYDHSLSPQEMHMNYGNRVGFQVTPEDNTEVFWKSCACCPNCTAEGDKFIRYQNPLAGDWICHPETILGDSPYPYDQSSVLDIVGI